MIELSSVSLGPGLNIRNRIACLAPRIASLASSRSTWSIVGVNQSRDLTLPIVRLRPLLFGSVSSSGDSSPESFSKSHCLRYCCATFGSSISRELLAWVQRPVFVQFWLPVHTQRGPFLSSITRNLLWPSAREIGRASCREGGWCWVRC